MKKYFTAFIIVSFFILIVVSVTRASTAFQSVDSDAANLEEVGIDRQSIATMVMGEGSIEWQPIIENAGMVLTISGPGDFYLRQGAQAGNMPVFFVVAADGTAVPDGNYAYELLALPIIAPEVQDAMAKARENGDAAVVSQLRAEGKLPQEAAIQSGYFTVLKSAIVDGAATAEAFAKADAFEQDSSQANRAPNGPTDQQILDDLIVVGSACIGQDCNNGESFGFDTIRIKENNLRIKAQDTSNSASFPTNDWQITFNDSSNGGANKFSIDDIDGGRTPFTIEAAAPSHSLYVDNGGRVGLGTNNPVVELHVVDGDTPTLRLEQDGSSGFGPQTWDIAGNETNFFVRDASNGSQLPFRIFPGADQNSLTIAADNNIGMGVQSPDAALEVTRSNGTAQILVDENDGTSAVRTLLALENNGPPQMTFTNTAASDTWQLGMNTSGNLRAESVSGGLYLELQEAGNMIVSNTSQFVPRMNLLSNGNLIIAGTFTELMLPSSAPRDHESYGLRKAELLMALPELDIVSRSDTSDITHIAPDAATLLEVYGLGDGQSISALDVASLSLLSTQALQEQVQAQEALIADQQEQINDLEARMAEIEALLVELGANK